MRLSETALLAITLVATVACTPEPAPKPAPPPSSTAAQSASDQPRGQELNEAIQQPMDRARAVEGELMKAKDTIDAELDQQNN